MSRIRIGNMQYTVTRAGCFYYEFGRRVYMNLFWLKLPDATTREIGLHKAPAYYRVYKILEKHGKWMHGMGISRRYGVPNSTVAQALKKLCTAGYVGKICTENEIYYRALVVLLAIIIKLF